MTLTLTLNFPPMATATLPNGNGRALAGARPLPLPLDRPVDRDPRHADGLHQPVDRADLAARHLPRDRPQPAHPRQHRLHALDADGLHGRAGRARGDAGPGRRHVRTGQDLQPRLRRVHRSSPSCWRSPGSPGRPAPSGSSPCGSARASAGPCSSPTPRPSSPTPSRPTSAGSASGINNVAAIAGSFIGLVLGGLLAPVEWHLVFLISVPFGILGTVVGLRQARGPWRAHPGQDRLAGQRHLRRRPRSSSWSGSPTACCPTAATPWAGPARSCWPRSSVASPSWSSSGSSRPRWPNRCSACRSSASGPSRAGNVASFLASLSRGGLDVHAHHLAAGDLAPAARLQLLPDAAVGRHLHDPADRRVSSPPAPSAASWPTATAPARSPPAAWCSWP